MAWRPHGRARVNANSPRAFATCDRCSLLYNLVDLNWQYQYAGNGTYNTRLKVCCICMDVPSQFLRTIILPADPVPVDQPRPEPYAVDENAGAIISGGGGVTPPTPPTGFEIELESGEGGIELENGNGTVELEVGP